jgi:spermidine/putrescine transport system permease protein
VALPLTNPEVVLAAALPYLFVGANLQRGPLTLLLAHSLFCLSYATLTLKARLAGGDWNLEVAAQDLGASPLPAFRRVTLPAFRRVTLSAALLAMGLRRPPAPRQAGPSPAPGKGWPGSLPPEPTSSPPFPPP